jgi:ubiquinone/menaquinone biosynthesis C-methylase UbiE
VNRQELGQKFARLTTNAVVSNSRLWRLFRPLTRRQFHSLASRWDTILQADHLAPYERALDELPAPPRRALDLGTGTGSGAFMLARRFPEADVTGADLAEGMIAEARRKLPPELAGRVHFEVADAAALPFPDESFDLVAHANMIPFFDEVARVLAPGGHALFAFSGGSQTPIYVPRERLRSELGRRGFTDFADFETGRGTSVLARKGGRS